MCPFRNLTSIRSFLVARCLFSWVVSTLVVLLHSLFSSDATVCERTPSKCLSCMSRNSLVNYCIIGISILCDTCMYAIYCFWNTVVSVLRCYFFSAELSSISIVSTGGGGSAHAKLKVR